MKRTQVFLKTLHKFSIKYRFINIRKQAKYTKVEKINKELFKAIQKFQVAL